MGESMRKIFMLALPVIMCVFLACGCAVVNEDDVERIINFDCQELFNLRVGTAEKSNEIAMAPLQTNTTLENCVIEYDDKVISYNPVTGEVVALNAGVTKIRASSGDKSASVQVVVDRAVYCTSLKSETKFVEINKAAKLVPSVNAGYNMGFSFVSLNPEILTIDNEGNITSYATGVAQVKVSAKRCVNKSIAGGYEPVYAVMTINVVAPRTTLTLDILDNNMNALPYSLDEYGIKNYNLYSTQNKQNMYILKLSSDQSLDNCYFTENTTVNDCQNIVYGSLNSRLFRSNLEYRYLADGCVYLSFYTLDAGKDYIEQAMLESGLNYFYKRSSERVCINVRTLTTSDDISLKVYSDEGLLNRYDLKNSKGQYYLYAGEQASTLYVNVDINKYCDGAFTFDSQNLTVTRNGAVLQISHGTEVGVGILNVYTSDGSELTVSLTFYNEIETVTIMTDVELVQLLYLENGAVSLVGNYEVRDSTGEKVNWQNCEYIFYDSTGKEIEPSSDAVTYTDTVYPTFAIQFGKEGKYSFRLKSVEYGYLSEIITVYVFDEDSLQNWP